jgi:hypothetical protein
MAYRSPADRERDRWATLSETVSYVMAADGCAEAEARLQIQKALYAGALRPLKWEDAQMAPRNVGGMSIPLDEPYLTPNTEIDWVAGTLLDISEHSPPPGRHRVLLVLWLRVRELWPQKIAALVPRSASSNDSRQPS